MVNPRKNREGEAKICMILDCGSRAHNLVIRVANHAGGSVFLARSAGAMLYTARQNSRQYCVNSPPARRGEIISGAGRDAAQVSRLTPAAMIFHLLP